ncbi:unnamed protein product [Hydatigera taeniaeformis]|uniref:Transmembrane protein 186 n=1 Tax=Hydatigena taeniaeformis TaxID=6205 RepID=A0A0R3WNG0_HYDTA|nr:unnamed protein product [Hydatigera taeniaeformis]
MIPIKIGRQLSSNGVLYSLLSLRCFRALHVSLNPIYSVSRLKPFRKPPPTEGGVVPGSSVEGIRTRSIDMDQAKVDLLTKHLGHPDDWQLIYRLRAMPIAQALSRLKLFLTFALLAGASASTVGHLFDKVDVQLCQFLLAASLFSLCTLCAFSFYSTKVVGVVSCSPSLLSLDLDFNCPKKFTHKLLFADNFLSTIKVSLNKSTGLLRLGLLTFWGKRHNILIRPEQLLPATDLSNSNNKRTVCVGLTGDILNPKYSTIRFLYVSSVTGQIGDRDLFEKHIGRMWQHL